MRPRSLSRIITAPRQSKLVRRRLVFAKRCNYVVDKGTCRWLGGSAAGIDRVELDGSRVPFRQQPNELSSFYFPAARDKRSHDGVQSRDGSRYRAFARPCDQPALDLEGDRAVILAKGPMPAEAAGPENDCMMGQIRRCSGEACLFEVSSRGGKDARP